jgi:hypothetical protein
MVKYIAQVFSLLLAIIAISKSYVDFRARRESLQMFVLWTVTWSGIVLFALFPQIIDVLLGGSRAGVGTFLGMGVVFVFFLLYRVYARVERLEQKLTSVVQEVALHEASRTGIKPRSEKNPA